LSSADEQIVERVKQAVEETGAQWKHYTPYDYTITGASALRGSLELVPAGEKRVPPAALIAPRAYREELLRGLLATDGCAQRYGATFTSTSLELATGVRELVRSLGGTARIDGPYQPKIAAHAPQYVVLIRFSDFVPFYVSRKAEKFKLSNCAHNQIVSIERTDESVPMACIRVDAEDSQYVTTGYTLTHNSDKNVRRGYRAFLKQCPPSLFAKTPPSEAANDRIIRLTNGSNIEFYTSGAPDSLAGEGVNFLVVDEAALIAEAVWYQLLRPTLADTHGRALIISTPRGRNWFWKLWMRGQRGGEYESWHFRSDDSPYVDASEVEDARDTLPQILYRQEFLAEFVASAASMFDLSQPGVRIVDDLAKPSGVVVMGADLAKKEDFTVLTAANSADRAPCLHERLNEVSWPVQEEFIVEQVRYLERQPAVEAVMVMVDATGLGDVVFDHLDEHGIDVVPIVFSGRQKELMVRLLAADVEKGRAAILREQVEEFEGYEFEITDAGRYKFGGEGVHDDEVSAKLMENWGLVHEMPGDIHVLGDPGEGEPEDENLEVLDEPELLRPDSSEDIMRNPAAWS